jgi:hypothetical protein
MVSEAKIKVLTIVLNVLKLNRVVCQLDKNNKTRFPVFYTQIENSALVESGLKAIGFKFNEYLKAFIRPTGEEINLEAKYIEGKRGLFAKVTIRSGVDEVGGGSIYIRGKSLLKSIQSNLSPKFTYIETMNVLRFIRPTDVDVNDTLQKLAQLGFKHLADDKVKLDADTYNIKKQFSNGDDGLVLDVSYKQSKPVFNMMISYKYCGNNKA